MVYRLHETVLLFFIYACLGWGCEVAFAAVKEGRFINRGFLNGPICPIYGFGVLGVVMTLDPVKENVPLLFLGSLVLTTGIEFATGFILEKLFHARWWDYSDMPLNLMGYVTLPFSLVWGAACLGVVRWVHPALLAGTRALPMLPVVGLDSACAAIFTLDLCATVSSVRKLSKRLERLTELGAELHSISDELGQGIFGTTLAARDRVTTLSDGIGRTISDTTQMAKKKATALSDGIGRTISDTTQAAKEKATALSDGIGRTISDTTQAARNKVASGGAALGERGAQLLRGLEQAERRIAAWLEASRGEGGERVSALLRRYEGVRARLIAALEEHGFGHRRLLDAFPNLRSERYQEAVETLRAFYRRHRK